MTLHYKKAMERISMSPEAMENMQVTIRESNLENIQKHSSVFQRQFSPRHMTGIAAVLCLALVLLSVGAVSAYGYFFHEIPEEVAGGLQPVKLTDTSQDIVMTVQYASVEEGTLAAYVTLEDISGLNRLVQGADFYNDYRIDRPESADEMFYKYRSLGYDEDSHTYGFLVEITPSNASGDVLYFQNQQYTLSVGQIMLGQKVMQPVYMPDWSMLSKEPDTCMRNCSIWGYVDNYSRQISAADSTVKVLQPGSWDIPIAEGYTITAAGFLDTGFHIQIRYDGEQTAYDHEIVNLIASDGHVIGNTGYSKGEGNFCYVGFEDEKHYRYREYIFDITPEALEGASVTGEFTLGGMLLEGDWEVTFSLEEVEKNIEDSVL